VGFKVGFGATACTVSFLGFLRLLLAADWQLQRPTARKRVKTMVFKAKIFQYEIGFIGKIIGKNHKNKSNFDEQKYYA
jgi:hypothetical protein